MADILDEVERGRSRITLSRPEQRDALGLEVLATPHGALWEGDGERGGPRDA